MKNISTSTFLLIFLFHFNFYLFSYQPNPYSLPRWSKGIGLQTGYQNRTFGETKDLTEVDSFYWLGGAYSFTRSLGITTRITFDETEITEKKSEKEEKSTSHYNTVLIGVPIKFFFDQEDVTINTFVIPSLIYYSPHEQWQGGGTVGLFRESFYTYFTLSFTYFSNLNAIKKKELTEKLDYHLFHYTITSDMGIHLYYNEDYFAGVWGLMRFNLHQEFYQEDNAAYHFTLQPTLLAYYQSITILFKYIFPVLQDSDFDDATIRSTFFLQQGFSIGIAKSF